MRGGFGTSSEMCRSGEKVNMTSILNKNVRSNREYVIFSDLIPKVSKQYYYLFKCVGLSVIGLGLDCI